MRGQNVGNLSGVGGAMGGPNGVSQVDNTEKHKVKQKRIYQCLLFCFGTLVLKWEERDFMCFFNGWGISP